MKIKEIIKGFIKEEDAIGIVEIILILVILIAIIVIFRSKIIDIVTDAFDSITKNSDEAIGDITIE
jgi:Flp pilus assembly pilin Flp